MEAIKKIQEARKLIKERPLKKLGYNEYSKYDYYTPEQVDKMVFEVSQKLGLFNKFDLIRTEHGLMAELRVIDIDSGKYETFKTATEIPTITATNVAQQLGGAMTFSNRYLLMFAFDIVDNNLDFDTPKKQQENKPKEAKYQKEDNRPWLSEEQLNKVIARIKANDPGECASIKAFVDKIKAEFHMKKTYREEIETLIK